MSRPELSKLSSHAAREWHRIAHTPEDFCSSRVIPFLPPSQVGILIDPLRLFLTGLAHCVQSHLFAQNNPLCKRRTSSRAKESTMWIKSCAMAAAVVVGTLGLVGKADAQLIRRGAVYYPTIYSYPSSGVVYSTSYDPTISSGVVVAGASAPYVADYYSPGVYNAGYYNAGYYGSYYAPYYGRYYSGWGRRLRW
jgi:hypothetical protein